MSDSVQKKRKFAKQPILLNSWPDIPILRTMDPQTDPNLMLLVSLLGSGSTSWKLLLGLHCLPDVAHTPGLHSYGCTEPSDDEHITTQIHILRARG